MMYQYHSNKWKARLQEVGMLTTGILDIKNSAILVLSDSTGIGYRDEAPKVPRSLPTCSILPGILVAHESEGYTFHWTSNDECDRAGSLLLRRHRSRVTNTHGPIW